MEDKILQLYKERCRSGKDCNPVYVIKTYSNGGKHCSTQCATCGDSQGSPVSRKTLDPAIQLNDFDEQRYQQFVNSLFAESEKAIAVQQKLFAISKGIKKNYFFKTLQITETEFTTAYEQYLLSEQWQSKRKRILERDNHTCLYCKERRAVHVHHLSYRNLGNESDFELMSVCLECHQQIHEEPTEDLDRAANYIASQKIPFKNDLSGNNQYLERERPRKL